MSTKPLQRDLTRIDPKAMFEGSFDGEPTFPERYSVVDQIGKGGAALVYCATDTQTDSAVALKTLFNLRHLQRFRTEVAIQRTLEHEHIVQVLDADVEAVYPWMVMPLADATLLDLIRQGPLTAAVAIDLILPILEALRVAHETGIVHRDIKPSNILLYQGKPRLSDFGIAKTDWSGVTARGTTLGSRQYMAPEQVVDASAVGVPADIFGIGATLFSMVTGKSPLGIQYLPLDHSRWRRVPEALRRILVDCAQASPAARPQTATELAQRLEATR